MFSKELTFLSKNNISQTYYIQTWSLYSIIWKNEIWLKYDTRTISRNKIFTTATKISHAKRRKHVMEAGVEVNYAKKWTLNNDQCNQNSRFIGFEVSLPALRVWLIAERKGIVNHKMQCVPALAAMLSLRNW